MIIMMQSNDFCCKSTFCTSIKCMIAGCRNQPKNAKRCLRCKFSRNIYNNGERKVGHKYLGKIGKLELRYSCKYCPNKYAYLSFLNCHLSKHEMSRRVECILCKKYFFNKSTMIKHLKKKH